MDKKYKLKRGRLLKKQTFISPPMKFPMMDGWFFRTFNWKNHSIYLIKQIYLMLCNNFDLYMKTATFILSNWLYIKEGHPPFERILWCRFPFLFLEKRHASGNFEDISSSDQLEMNLRKIRNALIDCISSSTLKRSLFDYVWPDIVLNIKWEQL